jgi:hypothetical protein
MRTFKPALGLLLMAMFVFNDSLAQKTRFTTNGGLTIGLGGGTSYQKSDLANSKGIGFDFVIGSPLYQKENAFLSVDWKFRFLAGQNKAYDHRINPDDTYSNIRYSFFNYDLELGLTLNRLRERTGIVVSGFAGAGITHGRTYTDLYDSGGNLYDFSGIDPNRDKKLVYDDLVTLSDGNFETRLVNKAALLPTAGLFFGYQISRSITLGIEYKTNFYLTEKNSFVGIDLDNRIIEGSGLDRNNYITLGFRWNLRGGSSYNHTTYNYSTGGNGNNHNNTGTNNLVITGSLLRPSVQITDPPADPYHTESPTHTIRATVTNVSGPDNISFSQNGYPNNRFTYNADTRTFLANVRLREGENSFMIEAANQAATAGDEVMIMLDHPREAVIPAPRVEFTSPWQSRISSPSERMDVTASVKNISFKEDIQLTQDGRTIPFDYDPASGLVNTVVLLSEGDNNLLIKGSNESGSAMDQLTILFNIHEEMALPTVRFTNPFVPIEVSNNRFPLRAKTQNVPGRNDVNLMINGSPVSNFSFSENGAVSVNLFLAEGVNQIEIAARNEAGTASDRTSITYHDPVFYDPVYQDPVRQDPVHHDPVAGNSPPEINIIIPATYPFKTSAPYEELRATVLNVSTKENITLNINGMNTRDFNYNFSSKTLTARIALKEGSNVLTINAQNEAGNATKDQVFIKVKESLPCTRPVIRLIDPAQGPVSTNRQTYAVQAEIRNITNVNQLRMLVNGKSVTFSFSNNFLSGSIPLISGLNTISLNARNECGEANASASISYVPEVNDEPCTPPAVSFSVNEVNRTDATHELRGSATGVKNKSDISLTLDGRANSGFQFVPATGDLSAKFKLTPGTHTIVVTVSNACGKDSKSKSVSVSAPVVVEEGSCGVRFNPGNADWQFCLVTPSGTFSRDNLTNSDFSYSGRATSLFFMPVGGGGDAMVNGQPYAVRSGQYYLFTGNLEVSVSTTNPGSMGHWSVCINASRAPVSGNGNNRPKSPCETEKVNAVKGNGNRR